ncbi:MAG: phosphatidylglycerol:prolipoprotein diacylglycerol transferase [Lentimonas sp.]|jgi:phosphatidylglycerol:prolipoprotein diacylglycerol transferase
MATTSSYWVHDLSPFLIRFPDNSIGLDGIRYYGLSYLFGFLAAWGLLRLYNAKGKFAIDADARATLMTAVILGVIVGGRLGYMLLYDLEAFLQNPLLVLKVNQGGMASHGGFLGVLLAVVWFARKYKYNFFKLGDVIVTLAPLGLCFGRIANFWNGELWGRVTDVNWAVIFPHSPTVYNAAFHMFAAEPRHPSQLYAAALEGALLFTYAQWRFWRTSPPAGQIGGEFLIGYGIVRIFGELFREPDAALIMGLSRGQFYSIFMILAGAAIIRIARRKQVKA